VEAGAVSVSVAPLRRIAEPFSATGYPSLWLGAVLTATAMWIERVAIGWYIFQATDSAFLTSAAVSAQMGSGFFFGPLGGAIADRSPRPRILSLAISGRALTIVGLAFLTAAGLQSMLAVFALLAIGGVAQTLHFSSLQTLSADLVGVERRASGISMVSIGQRVVSAFGALGSGFMVTALGPTFALAVAALLTGLGALAYARVREPRERHRIAEVSLLKDTVEGLRIVGRVPIVAILLGLMIIIEIFGYSFFALTPAIADRVLNVGVEGLGGLNAAPAIGGVFALLFLAAYSTRLRMGFTFAIVYLLFGAMVVVVGASPWYAVSLLAAAGIGACAALVDALEWVMLQGSVDDRLRGRALGAWNLTIGLGWVVGPLTMGAFADAAGVTTAFTTAGIIVMVTAVLALAISARLRAA